MQLFYSIAISVVFLVQAFAIGTGSDNSSAPFVFHFDDNGLKFDYPYSSAERTHCIDLQEEETRQSYTNLVIGALSNPDISREEAKLPIKLPGVLLPSLAILNIESEEEQAGELSHPSPASPLDRESSFIKCAFTHNRIQYFTTYPQHPLNKMYMGASASKPSFTPFDVALEFPVSLELSTRFHGGLFSFHLSPVDFTLKLSALVSTQAALCLLPEAKFAHRRNAAHVRLQALDVQLKGFEWTAPQHGAIVNLLLCFVSMWLLLIARFCLYFGLAGLSSAVSHINKLLVEKAKFAPFTVAADYESIPIRAIEEIVESETDPNATPYVPFTPEESENEDDLDSMF